MQRHTRLWGSGIIVLCLVAIVVVVVTDGMRSVTGNVQKDEAMETFVRQGTQYLLGMIDEEYNGVHKYYYPEEDRLEPTLHTIYTASTAFTLMQAAQCLNDETLMDQALASAEFLLSMQDMTENRKKISGAFNYSFSLETQNSDQNFAVGTASKTIFTLLELGRETEDPQYLAAAQQAGDWLLTMQKDDGDMKPYIREDENGKLLSGKRVSLLYNGQVLSALSRLYTATQKAMYRDAARGIAQFLMAKVEKEGCYVGDDYRDPNPISSSWVIQSFLDYALASGNDSYQKTAYRCADELLTRQIESSNVLRNGRWDEAYSTSGNGWIAEVMVNVARICRAQERNDCDQYQEAAQRAMHWVMQYAYTPEKASAMPNPDRTEGGIAWSGNQSFVRTDTVCHGLNAAIGLLCPSE
ncbi:MAG: glycoside hydrolase family 76 protein [Candidatus Peribacteraceae bacterium]